LRHNTDTRRRVSVHLMRWELGVLLYSKRRAGRSRL
jgi:hypothetical protein